MVNIEYKNVTIKLILKVNKSKHVQINSFLYLSIKLFLPNGLISYPLETSFFSCFQGIQNGNMGAEMDCITLHFFRFNLIVLSKAKRKRKNF